MPAMCHLDSMEPTTHVFAVAVEEYQEPTIPRVIYAENDARKIVEAWQGLGAKPEDCTLLVSSEATLAALKSRFKKFLNKVADGDRVIFFYAGHGAAFNDVS